MRIKLFTILIVILYTTALSAKPVLKIAVAANFSSTLEIIAKEFTAKTGIGIDIIPGASGNLTTQIQNKAPFDIFLSADRLYPEQLLAAKLVHQDKIYDYAIGQLVFIAANALADNNIQEVNTCRKIAIADPNTAPYGRAAIDALTSSQLLEKNKTKFIIGASIGQTMNFIASGASDCGFVALSQVKDNDILRKRMLIVDNKLYAPLIQGAIINKNSPFHSEDEEFMTWLLNQQAIIKDAGYGTF